MEWNSVDDGVVKEETWYPSEESETEEWETVAASEALVKVKMEIASDEEEEEEAVLDPVAAVTVTDVKEEPPDEEPLAADPLATAAGQGPQGPSTEAEMDDGNISVTGDVNFSDVEDEIALFTKWKEEYDSCDSQIELEATSNPVIIPHCSSYDTSNQRTFIFRKIEFNAPDVDWKSSLPPPPCDDCSPLQYFKKYFSDNAFELLAEQSNLYAEQEDGVSLNTNALEMEQLVGIFLFMGLVEMPSTKMFWAKETRHSSVADVMSHDRFETLRRYLHLANNGEMKPTHDPDYDKLFKVRPLLNILVSNMKQVPPEEHQSIHEQIICFRGKSNVEQYNKVRIHKQGYRVFIRAGESGLMYEFEIYTGKGKREELCWGLGDIVLALTSSLPEGQNFKVYMDDKFSSFRLLTALRQRGIFCVGTISSERMEGCPFMSERELKANGRGSCDWRVEEKNNVALVRWFDRNAINFISTYTSVKPEGHCKRWSAADKKHVKVTMPNIVAEYNKFMHRAGLASKFLELYRINIHSAKWYIHIIYWCINMAAVNSWLLYQRHQQQKGAVVKYSLAQFQSYIACGLTKAGKSADRTRGADFVGSA